MVRRVRRSEMRRTLHSRRRARKTRTRLRGLRHRKRISISKSIWVERECWCCCWEREEGGREGGGEAMATEVEAGAGLAGPGERRPEGERAAAATWGERGVGAGAACSRHRLSCRSAALRGTWKGGWAAR
jgi:hypothetical protein